MNIRYLIITISHIVISQSQVSVGEDLWSHVKTSFPWENQLAQAQLLGVPVPSVVPTQCEQLCQRTAGCAGYNHNPTQRLCQPLAVDPEVDNVEPEISAGWLLYALNTFSLDQSTKRPCVGRPCSTHGICSDWMDVDGQWQYLCTCNHTWTGADCQQRAAVFNWEDWSDWGQCSVTCGEGYQQRTRTCQGPDEEEVESNLCIGAGVEMTSCPYLPCPVWDAWSEFDECTTWRGCGRGVKTRWRVCLNGGTVGVDPMCMGPETNTVPCFNPSRNAPVKLFDGDSQGAVMVYNDITSQWSYVCSDGWTNVDADVTCRQLGYLTGASQASTSTVTDGLSWAMSGVACGGDEASLVHCPHAGWDPHTCTSGLAASVICIVDGQWNTWSSWGECSVTCADGQRSRGRLCDYPVPSNGGASCGGEAMEIKGCTEVPCPVDGKWLSWSAWTECNITCGGGWTSRARECTVPLHEGANCIGDWEQIQTCNDQPCPVDGYWEPWGTWEECSASCGGGTQSRTRECQQALHGGEPCEGFPDNGVETQTCGDQPCPVNGGWSSWSEWSTCPVTCGGSTHARTRQCDSPVPQYGGAPCNGSSEETRPCSGGSCPVDGMFSSWGEWGECNATCGGGWRLRARSCDDPQPQYGGNNCTEPFEESEPCNQHECAIDGEWGSWSGWAACSQSCNEGYETRNRTCEGPFHGGDACIGLPIENRTCFLVNCPEDGNWSEWGPWQPCSLTCGIGVQVRLRNCGSPPPKYGGNLCGANLDLDTEEELKACLVSDCPVDGEWSAWSDWGRCSHTCGNGTQVRTRNCSNPAPQNGGDDCFPQDSASETQLCYVKSCAVDGGWGVWSDWGGCSTTCDEGETERTRACDSPAPQFGGQYCTGGDESGREHKTCMVINCPVDGQWSAWGAWPSCSVTCGVGSKMRERVCDSPSPQYGGEECVGLDAEEANCEEVGCPVDGGWSDFGDWSECSATCGGGNKARGRECTNPAPVNGGADCLGLSLEEQVCNVQPCPVDGQWGLWTDWGACSVTCGDAQRRRTRACDDPAPAFGGHECEGLDTEEEACVLDICPRPGEFLPWSPWEPCSQTCGGGIKQRERVCNDTTWGEAGRFTSPCEGDDTETRDCNDFACFEAKSCDELVTAGLEESAYVDLYVTVRTVIEVHCNVINGHASVGLSNGFMVVNDFEGGGEFTMTLKYVDSQGRAISIDALTDLADHSENCSQEMWWVCRGAAINRPYDATATGALTSHPFTGWFTRTNCRALDFPGADSPGFCDESESSLDPNSYQSYIQSFTGAPYRMLCACGQTGTCIDPDLLCNCDANDDSRETRDGGFITNKQDLPILAVYAGDTGAATERGNFSLGPLVCQGEGTPYY